MWHPRVSLTYPRFRTRCTERTWHGRSRLTGPPRGGHLMISPLCICRRCGRDGCRGRCRKACMRGTKARWGRVKFRVMFHKSGKKFGKFRASGFRTVHSASRLRRAGRVRYKWRDFSVGRSGFDLSVSGRPPTSSEAAGPLEKKQNKHCFLAVTPPLSTWWVDQARRRRKFYGGTTLKITFSILLADRPLRRDISDGSFSGFWF